MSYISQDEYYFSPGFNTFVLSTYPWENLKKVSFPSGCHNLRISSQETPHNWFKRIVDEQLNGKTEPCAVEENMAVFAKLVYDNGIITYSNVQVIIVDDDLDIFYKSASPANINARYLRLDYDLSSLGEMFTHPHPHIHVTADGVPRFDAYFSHNGNIIIDFFDFIYRNFFIDKWKEWARNASKSNMASLENANSAVFDLIVDAFKANQCDVLTSKYANHIFHIKEGCRAVKEKIFPNKINPDITSVLCYDK